MMNEDLSMNYEKIEIEGEKPKKKSGGKLVALALCCSLIGGGLGAGGTIAGMKYFGSQTSQNEQAAESNSVVLGKQDSPTVIQTANTAGGSVMSASDIYAANVNSTVGIKTQITTNYFGYQTNSAASGSGFIISEDGYIVTNQHVIEGASEITVSTYDDKSYTAKLIGSDESNDIAVLKIDAEGLTPVSIGSSDSLRVGDDVFAIGNPLGELTFSLTTGVVSALDRDITTTKGSMSLIQTDCAINSGNSGGALFNGKGEVVGITNAKYSSSSTSEASIDNIGFAIPVDSVMSLISSIIENGYVVKPYIGVSVGDLGEDYSGFGLPAGAVVKGVDKNSPAEKAGLKLNDIITSANGTEISSSSDLVKLVRAAKKGDKLELGVYRSGEEVTVTVTVDESKGTSAASEDDKGTDDRKQQDSSPQQSYPGFDPNEFFGGMFGY